MCVMDLSCCPFSISADTELCRKNAVVVSSPIGHTWLHSPSSPSPLCPSLSPRLSDLSLCSMHPCPVPDAEAHGKDGNNCPEQLYLSNGEVSRCFFSCCLSSFLSTVRHLLQWCRYCPPVCRRSLMTDFCICILPLSSIALLMPTCCLSHVCKHGQQSYDVSHLFPLGMMESLFLRDLAFIAHTFRCTAMKPSFGTEICLL